MYKIDDSMLALILRFVGGKHNIAYRDKVFMHKQLKAIRAYVAQFPAAEQEKRALEWIEGHAREYREAWEKSMIDRALSPDRCSDCPLASSGEGAHCGIHDEWVELLQQYATNKITSRKYVKTALKILSRHKHNLKVTLSELEHGKQ